ncbi:MAG: hypothetical protein R2792_05925 [Saprospiraceae bacterium]|jgi:hypothetical protein
MYKKIVSTLPICPIRALQCRLVPGAWTQSEREKDRARSRKKKDFAQKKSDNGPKEKIMTEKFFLNL